jgi:hypothetical protein
VTQDRAQSLVVRQHPGQIVGDLDGDRVPGGQRTDVHGRNRQRRTDVHGPAFQPAGADLGV